ncbi:MAG: hypothetical protein LBH02_00465 [Methanocalculaceae archaeon]|nr:hypothetical protein [Methanocalculaceae archaeon]
MQKIRGIILSIQKWSYIVAGTKTLNLPSPKKTATSINAERSIQKCRLTHKSTFKPRYLHGIRWLLHSISNITIDLVITDHFIRVLTISQIKAPK